MSLRVSWEIDFEPEDFEENRESFEVIARKAAQEAMEIIMSGSSWAFDVRNLETKEHIVIDFTEEEGEEN
jgi:hypothetical protein